MPIPTVRLEPLFPFDDEGHPEAWLILTSQDDEYRRFGSREKALAEAFVIEFNIKAYETDRRLRDARPSPRKRAKAG